MSDAEPPKSIPPSIPPRAGRNRPSTQGAKRVERKNGGRTVGGGAAAGNAGSNSAQNPARPSPTSQAGRNYRSAQSARKDVAGRGTRSASSPSAHKPIRAQEGRPRVDRESVKSGRQQVPPSYAPASNRSSKHPPPSYAPNRQSFASRTPIEPARTNRAATASTGWKPQPRPNAPTPPPNMPQSGVPRRKPNRRRRTLVTVLVVLAILVGWPLLLLNWAGGKIEHVDALSTASDTPGTTYLIAGSDSRDGTQFTDETEGHRSDTIMLLHRAPNGNAYLISIPRDTWVDIPEYGEGKINSSFAYGGPELLVDTVEELSGITVDHYVEVGMQGVVDIVDAMGGVELCLDYDVDDARSELVWQAGCHNADGHTSLAFARMRYSDPNGDIGRAERQRQVIGAIVKTAAQPSNSLNPMRQMKISSAAAQSVSTDPDTSSLELARMAWDFRAATTSGNTGTPPIATIAFETSQGSAVLLDDDADEFFRKLANGTLTSAELQANAMPE